MTSRRAIRRANRSGRPNRLCTRTVETAVLALPRGDVRDRWERELVAGMYGLSTRRQLTYAAMTLATAWSLRRSVTGVSSGGVMTITKPRKPLGCILNIRHHYVRQSTEDGERYRRCTRCGKDKYDGPFVGGIGIAAAGPSSG